MTTSTKRCSTSEGQGCADLTVASLYSQLFKNKQTISSKEKQEMIHCACFKARRKRHKVSSYLNIQGSSLFKTVFSQQLERYKIYRFKIGFCCKNSSCKISKKNNNKKNQYTDPANQLGSWTVRPRSNKERCPLRQL